MLGSATELTETPLALGTASLFQHVGQSHDLVSRAVPPGRLVSILLASGIPPPRHAVVAAQVGCLLQRLAGVITVLELVAHRAETGHVQLHRQNVTRTLQGEWQTARTLQGDRPTSCTVQGDSKDHARLQGDSKRHARLQGDRKRHAWYRLRGKRHARLQGEGQTSSTLHDDM